MDLEFPICLKITDDFFQSRDFWYLTRANNFLLIIKKSVPKSFAMVMHSVRGVKASSDFKGDALWLGRHFESGTIYLVIMMKIYKAQPLQELQAKSHQIFLVKKVP